MPGEFAYPYQPRECQSLVSRTEDIGIGFLQKNPGTPHILTDGIKSCRPVSDMFVFRGHLS